MDAGYGIILARTGAGDGGGGGGGAVGADRVTPDVFRPTPKTCMGRQRVCLVKRRGVAV